MSFHIQIIKGSEPSNVVAIQIHVQPAETTRVGGRVKFGLSLFFFFEVRWQIMWQSCVAGQQYNPNEMWSIVLFGKLQMLC